MKEHSLGILSFLLFILSHQALAQDEFFHEIVIEKTLLEKEEWEFIGEANFKHLYDEPAWRRWGVSFAGVRRIKRFRILGGINSYYTFNRDITNFFEVRPLSAVQYTIPIAGKITLRQRLKSEWRFFYTEGYNSTRENYGRLRYQIGVDIPIPSGEESSWVIRPYFEWFFIRDPATFERFPNERDYGIRVIKSLKNEHELFFSYRLEEFYTIDTEKSNGHIFLIGYSF
ncbi:hypothetical protein SAMN05192553_101122 [Cyclobacterium xiamenense]|uniref:DUF2490 domain-containing protein n=1 Tax=Cyclobacterium xiamenense TaxID=1297121 RepID=A0A1H6T621_9BACT|nr:DUF2490 domain-containing protein [Cyclobacterium xiamenense]SEI75481.1 hypothetical protein SAMN05192553_101122 [Cyclobacterium xiamenense]